MFDRSKDEKHLATSTFFSGLSWLKRALVTAALTGLAVPSVSFAQPIESSGGAAASDSQCTRSYTKEGKWVTTDTEISAVLSLQEGSNELATVTINEVNVSNGKGLILTFTLYGSSSVSGGFGYQINNLVLNEATETVGGERAGQSRFFQGHETQLGRIYLGQSGRGDLSSLCNNLLALYERGIAK